MTQEDTSATTQEVVQETPQQPQQEQITAAQWQQFLGGLQEQNQALAAEVNNLKGHMGASEAARRQKEIDELPDKERADALQAQMDNLKQAGAAAQSQEISNSVWQRRDADAAARLLQSHNMNGTEAELYKGAWDVNWMPRFVASVDNIVKNKSQNSRRTDAANNPANKANVGNSTSSALPELDANASGFDTIKFALSRGKT